MNIESYEIFIEKIKNKEYETKLEYPKLSRYAKDTIIDENQTVKWNREEVERRNDEKSKELKKYRNSIKEGQLSFEKDVVSYIVLSNESMINKEQAEEIFKKTWNEEHSEGRISVLNEALELADFIIKMIDLKDKK